MQKKKLVSQESKSPREEVGNQLAEAGTASTHNQSESLSQKELSVPTTDHVFSSSSTEEERSNDEVVSEVAPIRRSWLFLALIIASTIALLFLLPFVSHLLGQWAS